MNEIREIKELIPVEEQYEIIDKILKNEINNKELTTSISKKFKEKNIPERLMMALFNEDKQWSDITEFQQCAFLDGANEVLKRKDLNIENWFSDQILMEYDTTVIEKTPMDSAVIKNMIKIDDANLLGYVPMKELYRWVMEDIAMYNYSAQRKPEYVEIGTGEKKKIIKKYSVNDKNVTEMSKAMLAGDYEEDMLWYNVLIRDQKNIPQVSMIKTKQEGIVDVTITPNYDRKSDNYTYFNPLDGWNRTIAGCRAYEEAQRKGIEVNFGFPIKVTMRDLKGSQKIVNQIFKRTDTDKQWLDQLEDNDYNTFVDMLVSKSSILNKKVVKTYEEYEVVNGSITYSAILAEAVRMCATDIQVNSKIQRIKISQVIAEIIDTLFEFFMTKHLTMKELIKETHLADVNLFVGYIAIANTIRELDDYDSVLLEIGEKLCSMPDEEFTRLKLINKSFSIKNVYNYFEKLAKDVINGEN